LISQTAAGIEICPRPEAQFTGVSGRGCTFSPTPSGSVVVTGCGSDCLLTIEHKGRRHNFWYKLPGKTESTSAPRPLVSHSTGSIGRVTCDNSLMMRAGNGALYFVAPGPSQRDAAGNVCLSQCAECKNCRDSSWCLNCVKCRDSKRCTDCSGCHACKDCADCHDCHDCKDCIGCRASVYCKASRGLTGCSDCINCVDCEDCSDCVDCLDCTDCRDCVGCSGVTGGRGLRNVHL